MGPVPLSIGVSQGVKASVLPRFSSGAGQWMAPPVGGTAKGGSRPVAGKTVCVWRALAAEEDQQTVRKWMPSLRSSALQGDSRFLLPRDHAA